MYTDIIHYELANSVNHDHFLNITAKVLSDWMQHQKGFVSWTQYRNSRGGYTDIVVWESKKAAQKAEAKMAENPHQNDWVGCYKNIQSESLESVR
jgi:hypothetical protein